MAQPDFDRESGALLLRLDEEPVRFAGRRFQPKSEVHIPLIGKDLGATILDAAGQDETVLDQLQAAVRETDWRYRLTDTWVHVSARQPDGGPAETIIPMAELPELGAFYRQLGTILGRAVAVPPAHVAVYTRNEPGGIGLANAEALRRAVVRAVEPRE